MRLPVLLLLAAIALAQDREVKCTIRDTGADDAYAGSCETGIKSIRLIADFASSGAASVDFGLGPIAIKRGSADPDDGAIPGSAIPVMLYYDGTYLQIEGAVSSGGSAPGGSTTGLYSSSLSFGAIADGTCPQQTFTATGLAAGRSLALGPPAGLGAGLVASARASAADTVAIRLCNFSGAAATVNGVTFAVRDMEALGYYTGSGEITFGEIQDGNCASDTITVTGAASGDNVADGWPAALEAGLVGKMLATATNTVTVRICNWSGAALTPAAAQTFRAAITK